MPIKRTNDLGKIDLRLRILGLRLRRDATELAELQARRLRLVTGKLKAVPPKPVTGKLAKPVLSKFPSPEFDDELPDDLRPVAPGSSGPC